MSIKNKFSYDGKNYRAEPAPHVRLPDGTVLKVVSADGDGNAQVKVEKKPPASGIVDAIEDVPAAPEAFAPAPTGLAAMNEASLRQEWAKREDANKVAQAAASETQSALLDIEAVIAKKLIAAGKNAVFELPGGVRVKGRSDATLGARLTRVGVPRVVSLDAPPPAAPETATTDAAAAK